MFFKKRKALKKAYEMGQNTSETIRQEIDDRMQGRVYPVIEKILQVFTNQILSVLDAETNQSLFSELKAEGDIFTDQLRNILGELRAEINISLYKWDFLFEKDQEIKSLFDQYITKKMDEAKEFGFLASERILESWLTSPKYQEKINKWNLSKAST